MANSHYESSAKNTEKRVCGPAVKSHTRPNKGRRFCARRKFRTLRCPWIVVKFLYQLVFYIATAGLIKYIFKSGNRAKSRWGTRKLVRYTKNPKQKKGDNDGASGLRNFPERFEEFTENVEETEVPAPVHIYLTTQGQNGLQVASRKHSIFTHFPKDRNCEVCLRSKMKRASCRRRTGETVPRTEKFGDLRPADHKVFSEEGESRNNHRYNSQEFGRSCEELSWNHRSETHVIAERAVRRIKRSVCGTVAIRLG